MTPCVEVVAVWTVPGAVSPGCILTEPRKGDKLTPGCHESVGFGANKRKGNVGNVSCMNQACYTPFAGTGCFQVQVLLGARWIGSLFCGD